MARRDAGRRRAHRPGGLDVGLLPDRQHLAPDQPDQAGDEHEAHRQDDVEHAVAPERDDGQREDQRWEGEGGVGQPHDHGVGAAAPVAGEQGQREGEGHGEGHDPGRGDQGVAGPVDHPAEEVPAEVVGAEPVLARRRVVDEGRLLVRRVRRDQGSEHREGYDQQQDGQAHHPGPVAPEPPGQQPPGAGGRCRGVDLTDALGLVQDRRHRFGAVGVRAAVT